MDPRECFRRTWLARAKLLDACAPGRLGETRTLPPWGGGGPQEVTVDQVLSHVYTHELRHQGQIQAALRFLGRTPPNADWI